MDAIPVEPQGRNWYLITFIVCAIIAIVYYFISPYLTLLISYIETVRSLMDMMIQFSSSVGTNVVDETAVGSKVIVNKLSRKKAKTETQTETPTKTKPPAPDESTSSIQGPGYCYVGEWKGVRSCVKIDKTPCKTQVYSTDELCVNPTLRP
jgi:hypothetical protein